MAPRNENLYNALTPKHANTWHIQIDNKGLEEM